MVIAPLLFALAAAASTEAQSVTVEIVTVGHSDTPAQRYEASAYVTVSADTKEAANDLLAKRKQALIDQLKAVGARITSQDEAMPATMFIPPIAVASAPNGALAKNIARASATIKFTTPDQATMARAQTVAAKDGNTSISHDPTGVLADPASARRAAKADGLDKARAEAQAYASKLGLPVITLVDISEKGDLGAIFLMSQDGRTSPFGPKRSTDGTVPTDVPMTVTFRLEPKR